MCDVARKRKIGIYRCSSHFVRGMQVAMRTTSKGTSIPLWKHEFYAVCKTKGKFNGAQDLHIYQALEFSAGSEMPLQCRNGLYL